MLVIAVEEDEAPSACQVFFTGKKDLAGAFFDEHYQKAVKMIALDVVAGFVLEFPNDRRIEQKLSGDPAGGVKKILRLPGDSFFVGFHKGMPPLKMAGPQSDPFTSIE